MLAKVPEAPVAGAVKVTVAPGDGVVECVDVLDDSGLPKAVLTVAL